MSGTELMMRIMMVMKKQLLLTEQGLLLDAVLSLAGSGHHEITVISVGLLALWKDLHLCL